MTRPIGSPAAATRTIKAVSSPDSLNQPSAETTIVAGQDQAGIGPLPQQRERFCWVHVRTAAPTPCATGCPGRSTASTTSPGFHAQGHGPRWLAPEPTRGANFQWRHNGRHEKHVGSSATLVSCKNTAAAATDAFDPDRDQTIEGSIGLSTKVIAFTVKSRRARSCQECRPGHEGSLQAG